MGIIRYFKKDTEIEKEMHILPLINVYMFKGTKVRIFIFFFILVGYKFPAYF